jgi:hypothetical protein
MKIKSVILEDKTRDPQAVYFSCELVETILPPPTHTKLEFVLCKKAFMKV